MAVAPAHSQLQWLQEDDALGVAIESGLPPVTSNIEVLRCEGSPQSSTTVEELSLGFAADAPRELQDAISELVSPSRTLR
ncbi:hypothetical protein AB1Y20_004485 [Prymnesium parvum]|uniref:Uncharacterized protein n=1 Tax=Prymnesium parvum TaxID=97485 RepID=A0AB34IWP5_PRYPA